jgi:hypothetical protein
MELIGATSTRITNASILSTVTDDLGADADYVTENGSGEMTVELGSKPSNSVVRLRLKVAESSSAAGGDIRFDDVAIKITFTTP